MKNIAILYSYIYTSEKRKQQTRFSMRKKIKIRILRISCRHSMNNILAFGHYWRAESLVGFTTIHITNDNTSLEVAENTDNFKNQDSYIQNWLLTCDEQYTGLRTLLKSWEPSGHNNITNDDTSFEVAENTDKQKWMWFRHTDRLYGMTALLFLYTTYTSLTK